MKRHKFDDDSEKQGKREGRDLIQVALRVGLSLSGDSAENILMAGDSLARTGIGRPTGQMSEVTAEQRTDEWGDLGDKLAVLRRPAPNDKWGGSHASDKSRTAPPRRPW